MIAPFLRYIYNELGTEIDNDTKPSDEGDTHQHMADPHPMHSRSERLIAWLGS